VSRLSPNCHLNAVYPLLEHIPAHIAHEDHSNLRCGLGPRKHSGKGHVCRASHLDLHAQSRQLRLSRGQLSLQLRDDGRARSHNGCLSGRRRPAAGAALLRRRQLQLLCTQRQKLLTNMLWEYALLKRPGGRGAKP